MLEPSLITQSYFHGANFEKTKENLTRFICMTDQAWITVDDTKPKLSIGLGSHKNSILIYPSLHCAPNVLVPANTDLSTVHGATTVCFLSNKESGIYWPFLTETCMLETNTLRERERVNKHGKRRRNSRYDNFWKRK